MFYVRVMDQSGCYSNWSVHMSGRFQSYLGNLVLVESLSQKVELVLQIWNSSISNGGRSYIKKFNCRISPNPLLDHLNLAKAALPMILPSFVRHFRISLPLFTCPYTSIQWLWVGISMLITMKCFQYFPTCGVWQCDTDTHTVTLSWWQWWDLITPENFICRSPDFTVALDVTAI